MPLTTLYSSNKINVRHLTHLLANVGEMRIPEKELGSILGKEALEKGLITPGDVLGLVSTTQVPSSYK